MDDGSKKIKKAIHRKDGSIMHSDTGYIEAFLLATNGFRKEDCDLLSDMLFDKYQIVAHVQSDRGQPRMSVSDLQSKLAFLETITKTVREVSCMGYKISGELQYAKSNFIQVSG